MGPTIHVLFIDANSGQVIGRSDMPLDQLPESFEAHTTLQIGGTSWSVERAEPVTAAEFAETGQLELILRKIETVALGDILYSLPTICDELPPLDPALDRSQCLVLHEDDWRQREFVTPDLWPVVDEQLAAIKRIYDEESRPAQEEVVGFAAIHVRTAPSAPLSARITLEQVMSLLPPGERQYTGVSFRGGTGAVPGSFAVGYAGCSLYGLTGPKGVTVLAVHGTDPSAVEPLRMLGLSYVDWVACTRG